MGLFPIAHGPAPMSLPRARHRAAPWVRRLARLGYGAKGVVYLVIGGVAVRAGMGRGEATEDSSGALGTLLRQPFGRALLAVVAVGLAGYVLWRLVQALLNPEHEPGGPKGTLRRAGYLVSAAAYAGLAVQAVRLLIGVQGSGAQSGDRKAEHWTALLLQQPAGRWITIAVGAIIVAVGLVELYRGARSDLRKQLDLSALGPTGQKSVVRFARFGLVCRGIVFVLIGWFLVRAAIQYDPSEAAGIAGALESLRRQPYGGALLVTVGLGMGAYGLWQLAQGGFRRIHAG